MAVEARWKLEQRKECKPIELARYGRTGLERQLNLAWGRDAINPSTRQKAPDQTEYDVTVDYRVPKSAPGFLQGVWFRARPAILDQADSRALGYQVRLIINWERNLF